MAYTTIDDPSAHFQTVLYTGDGASTQAITNTGNSDLQPDLIWCKQRSHATGHNLTDSTRGASKALFSEGTDAEDTGGNISSFNSDGFTTTDANRTNQSGRTFVAWQWKANGETKKTFTESGNNPGGSYQVNTTAGFSILDYTGTGAVGTVAHGLGAVPELMICKDRSSDGDDWFVYHVSTGNDGGMRFNTTAADGDDANRWNNTTPTSSVCTFGASGGTNDDGKATTAYVWAPIKGYSKFGSYVGAGGSQFVYTGFAPAFLIEKRSSNTSTWTLYDNKRSPFNERSEVLHPENNDDEETYSSAPDFLSNGFAPRGAINDDGETVLYIAFAEHPFVSSEGVPCTAR